MGRVRRALTRTLLPVALLYGGSELGAQVVAEPALLTAMVPREMTFGLHVAFPENGFVLGGMFRFPVARDVDLGGRAGLWFIEGGDDAPYVGGDLRYGLVSRPLTPGGRFSLSFGTGIGVSDPGPTIWKIPLGFVAGVGFGRRDAEAEIFAHPRVELGISTGPDDDSDAAVLFDFGGMFPITPTLSGLIDLRFGDGIFGEGDQVVISVGALWRL